MFLVLKNKHQKKEDWQPSASIEHLRIRAEILKEIRLFFIEKNVMEVETALMCFTSVPDPFIESIPVTFQHAASQTEQYYLQTSPEYMMKRLLAAGSGSIYQISKAFRQGEKGEMHNPEFTILEWYRPGFDHHQLMDEMDLLLQRLLKTAPAKRCSYSDLFKSYIEIDPHSDSIEKLRSIAHAYQLNPAEEIHDRDTWLNLLMGHVIAPQLGSREPCFIFDFPSTQAALARIVPGNPATASRFEVYNQGIELANGFHELQDANEQRKRFEHNLAIREQLGLNTLPLDERFLSALTHGLPDCAGVALGIDRLVMLATHANCLAEVISFDIEHV